MKKALKVTIIIVIFLALLLLTNCYTYQNAINTANSREKSNYPYLTKVGDLLVFSIEDHGDKLLVYNTNAAGYLRTLTTYTLDNNGNVKEKFIEICTYNNNIAKYYIKEEGYYYTQKKLSNYVIRKDLEKGENEATKEDVLNKFAEIKKDSETDGKISTTIRILNKDEFANFNMYN